ncbi:Protein transport protein Sec61 subunit alpha [Diplonema papillatum]|nr:Protein transport protein Sec61 subunit alpha [Diplonema papillatum]
MFLEFVVPILTLLPEVQKPRKKLDVVDRLVYTGLALMVFLVCSQVPVYGIRPRAEDAFYWMRAILASSKGTVMELGIGPMVTASMVLQFLRGTKLLSLNESSSRDRIVLQGTEKAFGLVITVVMAVLYVYNGAYGDVRQIGYFTCALIVSQLVIAGVICLLLDEMLQRGYGFGSAISLFIATNICESIVWQAFSFFTIQTGRGVEFEGAIIALFNGLAVAPNKYAAVVDAMSRTHLPNCMSLLSTVVVFVAVIFAEGLVVNLPLYHAKTKQGVAHKVKLFYTSNMPVILQSALVSNTYFISTVLSQRFKDNPIVGLLGTWKESRLHQGRSVPASGVIYYMTAPQGAWSEDVLHSIVYVLFVVFTCALFSRAWSTVSSMTSRDMAKQYYQNGYSVRSSSSSSVGQLEAYLDQDIRTACTLGGVAIGALTILADALGAVGSGTGILLAVTSIHSYYEQLQQEGMLK